MTAEPAVMTDLLKASLALVPAVIAGLPTLLDRIGRRRRQQEAITVLECLKRKYELEVLRKKEQLAVLPIPITDQELQHANPTMHEQRFFRPDSLRLTYTYKFVSGHRKYSAFATMIGSIAIAYSFALFWFTLAVIDPLVKVIHTQTHWHVGLVWATAVLYMLALLGLLLWGMRVLHAKRLAITESGVVTSPETKTTMDVPLRARAKTA